MIGLAFFRDESCRSDLKCVDLRVQIKSDVDSATRGEGHP